MKLNVDIIFDELPDCYNVKRLGYESRIRTLDFPVIYEPSKDFQQNLLYIVRQEILPPTPPASNLSVICIGRRPPAAWEQQGCQLLWISQNINILTLLNDVNGIFNMFQLWEQEIVTEIMKNEDFDFLNVLRLGIRMLKNHIGIVNNTLQSLFSISIVKKDNKGDYDIKIESFGNIVNNIGEIKQACHRERLIRGPFFSSVSMYGGQSYCCNVFLHDRFVGCMVVIDNFQPFGNGKLAVVDHFFSLCDAAFHKYLLSSSSFERPKISALNNLLQNLPLDHFEKSCYVQTEKEAWIFFILHHHNDQTHMPVESMCATLNVLLANTLSAIVQNNEIWGTLKISNDAVGQNELEFFIDYIRSMGYYAGVSKPYYDITQTHIHAIFAKYALEKGSKDAVAGQIYHFENYVLDYIIRRYSDEFPPEFLFPQGLLALISHDQNSSVSYIQTLQIYLDNSMHIQKTAKALFLHRSSLISRLEKINKFLNMNLNNPKERMYIYLCLYLMERSQE